MLLGVLLVLLVGCANVLQCFAGPGRAPQREIAVRLALGASRAASCAALAESAVIASVGRLVGVLLALWTSDACWPGSCDVPRLGDASIDVRVLAFAVALSACDRIVAASTAVLASRSSVNDALAEGGPVGPSAVAAPSLPQRVVGRRSRGGGGPALGGRASWCARSRTCARSNSASTRTVPLSSFREPSDRASTAVDGTALPRPPVAGVMGFPA